MKLTLKAARTNAGLSQAEASKELGIGRDTLSNWENGKSFPDAIKIKKIEEVYGIGYNDIIFLPHNYA